MDLLDFARGPALVVALAVFFVGAAWRVVAVLRLPSKPDLSPPRNDAPAPIMAALDGIVRGMWPRRSFGQAAAVTTFNGYVFHIGLALIFFGYAPHISFVQRLTGLSWPALPDAVMALASGATILSLLMALWLRLSEPVLRRISLPDDYISWTLTFLPVITGMAVISDSSTAFIGSRHEVYRGPLAVHLLTVELFLIAFPFSKLMHAVLFVFSRGATGMRFRRRGVQV